MLRSRQAAKTSRVVLHGFAAQLCCADIRPMREAVFNGIQFR